MKKSYLGFVDLVSLSISSLPISWQFFIGDMLGYLWFDILRLRRRVALENLRRCYPDWTEQKRIQVARASICHIGRTFIEFMRIPSLLASDAHREKWRQKFDIQGVENLRRALDKNHGVFLLTAHVGNGDWATVGVALNGYPISIISKEIKWQPLNKFWFETRERLGTDFIPDRQSSLTILKRLKKNHVVAFMLDQFLGPPIGIKTQFFGQETGTAMGLALLAGRSKAAVVPAYSYRTSDGVTHVVFEPEIPFVQSANKDETIRDMTQRYCDRIETWVREYPEQWMWVHRRWKKYKY